MKIPALIDPRGERLVDVARVAPRRLEHRRAIVADRQHAVDDGQQPDQLARLLAILVAELRADRADEGVVEQPLHRRERDGQDR